MLRDHVVEWGTMQSTPAMPERLTSEERRTAAREYRRRWANEVTHAIAEQGLTIHAVARLAGISPGALQAWLGQDVEPAPRAMAALASVINRHHLRLLELLGWLPEELGDLPLRLEATARLQDSLAEAKRWVEAATNVIGFSGAALISNSLLERGGKWEVTLRQSYRGHQYRAPPYATFLAFSRLGDPDPHEPSTAPADTERDRAEIQRLVGDELRRTNASWQPVEWTSNWPWVRRPDLVLSVPLLTAGKPRGLRQNLVVPPSICVVGLPYAGGPDVAALLATALDWAFTDLEAVVRERFDALPDSPRGVQAQSEIARRLLEDPTRAGRRLVWSYNSAVPITNTFLELRPDLPLVVFLKASNRLVQYTAQRQRDKVTAVELLTAQSTVEHALAQRDSSTYLTLEVPDLPLDSTRQHDVHVCFDAYVELAFAAAEWLMKEHGGPSLDDAPGLLAELWSSHRAR
jgi:transcriptional regulator with XRE-family HTH domain